MFEAAHREPGEDVLTLVDDRGNRARREFEVLSLKNASHERRRDVGG